MNTIPLSSNLSSRRSATGASVDKEGTANQHVLKDYLKRRNLILALVRREIERLSTWHNPLAQLDLNFTGLELLVTWANQTVFTERSWRDLVRLAWHISPDIAVFLPARCVWICHFCPRIRMAKSTHVSHWGMNEWILHLYSAFSMWNNQMRFTTLCGGLCPTALWLSLIHIWRCRRS